MVWQPLGDNPRPPTRTNVGTVGRRIQLKANFFPIQIKNPNIELFHYDVSIEDERRNDGRIPKKKKLLIFEDLKQQHSKIFENHQIAFDSEKNAYCIKSIKLLKQGFPYKVEHIDENKFKDNYIVKLNFANHASLRDLLKALKLTQGSSPLSYQTIFQMLDVMFQHNPALEYNRVGRNTFYSMGGEFGKAVEIGGGKDCVVGFFSSLRPCAWKNGSLLLNIDISHTAFYRQQPVLEFLKECLYFREEDFQGVLHPAKQKKLIKELKGLKVKVTHGKCPRTYRVLGLSPLGSDRQTFPMTNPETKETTTCTIQNYFKVQYRRALRYPRINCLKVGPVNKNVYLPIEVCEIASGQKVNKKLGDRETASMIRATAKRPMERLQSIRNIAQTKNFSNDSMIKALEFTIADQPVTFDGRVLPPPKLLMSEELEPRQGVWDARDRRFYNGAHLKSWVVMNYEPGFIDKAALQSFLGMLNKMGHERGMKIERPTIRESRDVNPEREFQEIKERIPDVQMILVILPQRSDIYARVKKVGDREINVLTQCIKFSNVIARQLGQIVGNLLLKINAKMGGINNILGTASSPIVFTRPVMIMGADVNHPPAGDKLTPSLAAVLGSMDKHASKYGVEVRHQKHRTEMIQEMKEMTKNLLKAFFAATRFKPERIVMYRDGVSESQFMEVLGFELLAMRAACTELQKDYTPAITFICVQKRHHTRLFCSERDGVGGSKNIPPGTTVDTEITHPTERDFYLCSHQGIQGTSRPTHYHVLWDDSDLNMDQLQQLTYAMCHLYARCTRSVSIPTPAYYAHLAAFRAKLHILDLCQSETSSQASGEAAASDAVMSQACKVEKDSEISSKFYYG